MMPLEEQRKFVKKLRNEFGEGILLQTPLPEPYCTNPSEVRAIYLGCDPSNKHSQTFPRVFVDDVQHPYRSAIGGPFSHKIIAPDVVAIQRTKTDARSIVQPQPLPLRLSLGHFQPFLTPQSFHSLMVHSPAFAPQQRRHSSISVTTIPACQGYNSFLQRLLIRFGLPLLSLRRSWLFQHTADTSF